MGLPDFYLKYRIQSVVIVTVLIVAGTGCSRTGDSSEATPEAQPLDNTEVAPYTRSSVEFPLPEFSFTALSGRSISSSGLRGKITILNFWATWCGPCVYEIPEFVVLYDDWKDRDFEIIGVSLDDEGFELVRPFAEDFAINYPVVIDDGTLAEEMGGVYALPTTFIIDESGTVIARFIGLFPADEMRTELDEMIKSI